MSHEHRASLSAIHYHRGFQVDALLLGICDELRLRGLLVGGLLQSSFGGRGDCADSVFVLDLRSEKIFDIWEERGLCARGCRLDESSLVDAESVVMAAIRDGVDLLVINRFGRAESLGRGLIGCFTAAIETEIPVLTAVRPPYGEAWRKFHSGLAVDISPDPNAAINWALSAVNLARAA